MNFIARHIQALGLLLLASFVAAAAALYFDAPARLAKAPAIQAAANYSCPMHPQVQSNRPGDCRLCGMALMQSKAGSGAHAGCNHATTADKTSPDAAGCSHAASGGGCCAPQTNAVPMAPVVGGCTRHLVTTTDETTP